MERNFPTRLADLRQLLDQLRISVQVDADIASLLEEIDLRLYAAEQDWIRLNGAVKKNTDSIRSLEKRYSELLYKLSDKG